MHQNTRTMPTATSTGGGSMSYATSDRKIIDEMKSKLSIAIVCISNVNRSMEAHQLLSKHGFNVRSFGVGDQVRIPGLSINKPNVYVFGTTYKSIIRDLESQNKYHYISIGLMNMMERNSRVKNCPERFQDSTDKFDIIITVNTMVMNEVINHIKSLTPGTPRRVTHIINIEIEDSLDSASLGAYLILDLLLVLCKTRNLNADISQQIRKFQSHRKTPIIHVLKMY